MFTERPRGTEGSDKLVPDLVVDLLAKYPKAALAYLEYLVYKCKTEVGAHILMSLCIICSCVGSRVADVNILLL